MNKYFGNLAFSTVTKQTKRVFNKLKLDYQKKLTSPIFCSARDLSINLQFEPAKELDMFCRQCEQAKDGIGCTSIGICGKNSKTAISQDALLELVKNISKLCVEARELGVVPTALLEASQWTLKATFSTLTNVNFSETDIARYFDDGLTVRDNIHRLISEKGFVSKDDDFSEFKRPVRLDDLEDFGRTAGILQRELTMANQNAFSLNELATAGAKGVTAYAAHCNRLGSVHDDQIMRPIHEVWSKLSSHEADFDGLLKTALRVGKINVDTLSLLDKLHAKNFGIPEPTEVKVTATEGKAILVSGHDLQDLNLLLQQTERTGINVYTHGEMLPAHAYPRLKSFPHLIGNYGTAWQKQNTEFASFPGPVVVTSNCILHPRRNYRERIYTTNEVGLDGVKHIGDAKDFTPVIEHAENMKGFMKTIYPIRNKRVGYNHRSLVPQIHAIINAIQSGQLSHIFLIGGCDGTEWDRSYYTDLALCTPKDSIILTLGCAKNRVINCETLLNEKLDNGMPRVMDMGQCNDSFSAIILSQEMANELGCEINDLPLSIALSFMEQKSVAVLLSLLHLGVKNIRLGPKIPAFISPGILQVLQDKYSLLPTTNAADDVKAMMENR